MIAAIVLAAGTASRMGRLKQLLPYGNHTLIHHAVEQALQAGFSPLIVVVGAEASQVRAALAGLPVTVTENPNWQSGMGSSVVCGMAALPDQAAAVAILAADQPMVTASHLASLQDQLSEGDVAIAAEYGGSIGVPAIFDRAAFPRLLSLPPEAGAKKLLLSLSPPPRRFPLPEAEADIDTPDEYAKLTS